MKATYSAHGFNGSFPLTGKRADRRDGPLGGHRHAGANWSLAGAALATPKLTVVINMMTIHF